MSNTFVRFLEKMKRFPLLFSRCLRSTPVPPGLFSGVHRPIMWSKVSPRFRKAFFESFANPWWDFVARHLDSRRRVKTQIKFFYRFLKIWLNLITIGNHEVVGLKQSHSRSIAGPTFHKVTPDFFFFPVHVDQYDSWQWSEWSQTSIRLEDDPANGWRCQGASGVECEETVSLTDVPESLQGHALRWTQPRIFSARALL